VASERRRGFLDKASGSTAVEYALLCMFIACGIVFALAAMGSGIEKVSGEISFQDGLTQSP
jgi:Flp pilus assembly pilin Flp